ncbi:MAG TPA: signal recognition particle protein [Sphingomonadales bacterium]|nr:signal recognition particle protein [Sphingomonadales bacterium]
MFETLTEKLGGIFSRLTGRGFLREADVDAALGEVRNALLEADVALPVVKDFVSSIRKRALGQEVMKSVAPGQQVVKAVHDALVEMLGGEAAPLNLAARPPVPILVVGLQGSGKTTTAGKIAKRLREKQNKKVLLASLDTNRPAAMEQLQILAGQAGAAFLPIMAGQMPADIAKRALAAANLQNADIVILDTAGRLHIDQALMAEAAAVKAVVNPAETLLVVDALTGQDAVNLAREFDAKIGVTGIVLTRLDGDARGGAALSMRAVTGKPIKLTGFGEKLDALDEFHPKRMAQRILGMGDVVSLVEKAAETIRQDEAEKISRKMAKGEFDLDDLKTQLQQMKKLGGMKGILSMLPGMGATGKQLNPAHLDDKLFLRQTAIIDSMTPRERRNPKLLNASRKVRIARGSGASVPEINKLLKMYLQMAGMMKRMQKMEKSGRAPDLSRLPPGFENLLPRK